jgi:hypothetical protein
MRSVLHPILTFRVCFPAMLGAVGMLTLPGCSVGNEPRMRLGSIPFPGAFTLYSVADPTDLGEHSYSGPERTSRGILYTARAGFLDLSHLRESMDIVKYAHDQIASSMRIAEGGLCVVCSVSWSDCDYGVIFCAPEWWNTLDAAEREAIIDEAAVRQAQRLAIVIGTWHEIGTWWGQETIPPFSEKNSALTWDDTTSHVVAAIIAGEALHDRETPWNESVTRLLGEKLTELGVVDVDCEAKAVEAVRGKWWWSGVAIRRDLDTGIATNWKTPWLVSDLDCCPQASPQVLPLPDLSDVRGHDLRAAFELKIHPAHWMIKRALGCDDCPPLITSENQILAAIEHLRTALHEEFGPEADNPDAPATRGEFAGSATRPPGL